MNINEESITPQEQTLPSEEELREQRKMLSAIYESVEKTRKYIFWTTVANVVLFVLPLVVVAIMFPFIINTFTSSIGDLGAESSTDNNGASSIPSLSESLKHLEELGY